MYIEIVMLKFIFSFVQKNTIKFECLSITKKGNSRKKSCFKQTFEYQKIIILKILKIPYFTLLRNSFENKYR